MDSGESDPDFVNHAPYKYERKRGDRIEKSSNTKQKSSRRSVLERVPGPKEPQETSQNIILELFRPLLANSKVKSDNDEDNENENEDGDDEDDEDDEEEQFSADEEVDAEQILSQAFKLQQSQPEDPRRTDEDSQTESDSDAAIEFPTDYFFVQPPSIPSTSQQAPDNDDSSTEADSEDDMFAPLMQANKDGILFGAEEGTDDREPDINDLTLHPRPGFSRNSVQNYCALALDDGAGVKVPAPVNAFLREYQREGIQFFWACFRKGRGGILGDDMGLGKTIQVISFLSAIMKKHGDMRDVERRRNHVSSLQDKQSWKRHKRLPPANATWPTCLIIAPSTVVHNWKREFETWGYFETGVYMGAPQERRLVLNDFKLGRLDVVISSFDTARGDIDLLSDLPWSVIFVDEAHKLKNSKSKITVAFNTFKCQVRFGLTGTAIQNSYEELWTILDWSNPKALGTLKDWTSYVTRPLAAGQSASATDDQRAIARAVANVLVRDVLPRFFLRRTKDLIRHQLPKKIDEVVFCPLMPKQIEVYKCILAHREMKVNLHKANPNVELKLCDCGSGLKRTRCCHIMDNGHFFTYLSILLKISNHLALILPSPNDTEEQIKRNREISKIGFEHEQIPKYGPSILLPQFCGKWEVLNMLLREWRRDSSNKILIFTKSVKLLDMLDYHLNRNGYVFCRLDGSTKQLDRMPLIDRFNDDPDVFIFLISTMAGGTGLNLTSANRVVIFDPNWNPAHDLQAMDRAYRFGQSRDVYVYRLLGAGSIEELIYARQVYKQQMMKIGYEASAQTRYFHGVQGDKQKKGELFGIENLFKLHEDTLATKMAIERAQLSEFDWALANMNARSRSKKKGPTAESETLEEDAKARRDDVDFRGLASLLLDDNEPVKPQHLEESHDIQQILAKACVKYSHQNEDLLRPSLVEEESLRSSLKRKAESSGDRRSSRRPGEAPDWPPRRRHHQLPQSPKTKLRSRQRALLETGFIRSFDELPTFASKFGGMATAQQEEVLLALDQHGKK